MKILSQVSKIYLKYRNFDLCFMMPASFSGPTSSLHGVKSQMRMWARKTREMSKTDRIQVLVSVSCEAQRSLEPKRVLVPSEGGYQPPCHDIHCRRMRLSLDLNEVSCFFKIFIYLGCVGSSLLHVQLVGATLQQQCVGFSLKWLLLLQSTGSKVGRFQQSWHMGLVALQHVKSPGIKPVSPAPTGRFLITGPPGKSKCTDF